MPRKRTATTAGPAQPNCETQYIVSASAGTLYSSSKEIAEKRIRCLLRENPTQRIEFTQVVTLTTRLALPAVEKTAKTKAKKGNDQL